MSAVPVVKVIEPPGRRYGAAAWTAPERAEVPQGEELPGLVQVQGGQVHQGQRPARGEDEVVDVA
jgi:hypothetical protein